MTEVVELRPQPDYFGGCPECEGTDRYLNYYRDHWFVCDEHKLRWWCGSNLFSSWAWETEEDWQENGMLLMGYREVKPS